MKLFGSHTPLTHHLQAKDRESYISSSLASPADLIKRLFSSSDANPSRALAMRFHKEWLHPDCPVKKWYQQQQQVRSSTEFTSVEHWRREQAPFYHEYLLIQLKSQGENVCRVERMGDGSRKDAITQIGCTAFDIIQCFPASEYALNTISQEPANLICRVEFPCPFDLLDVLAVCWSVQQTRRCSSYTIQRYNCYFLCLTILAILTRRVGEWESAIDTEDVWAGLVDSAITYLGQTSCNDADEYMGLKICHIIDPGNPHPRVFILESLRTRFMVDGLQSLTASASATLWTNDLDANIKQSLASHIQDSVDTALGSNNTCAMKMKLTLAFDGNNEDDCRAHDIPFEFIEAVSRQVLSIFIHVISGMARSAKRMRRMRELEYRPPLSQRMASWTLAPIEFVHIIVQASRLFVDEEEERRKTIWERGLEGWFRRNPLAALSLSRFYVLDINTPAGCDLGSVDHDAVYLSLWRALESPVCATQTEKLHALMLCNNRDIWVDSLHSCVGSAISNAARAHLAQIGSGSKARMLQTQNGSSGKEREVTVQEFHDHICNRIRTHSKNVESKRLATAILVELDITIAMGEVWKGLPKGYGGTIHTIEDTYSN